MRMPQKLRALLAGNGFDGRRKKPAIETKVDLRHTRRCREALIILRLVPAQGPNVIERTLLKLEQVVSANQFTILSIFIQVGDDGFVETGRHQVDQVHRLRELAVLLGSDLA